VFKRACTKSQRKNVPVAGDPNKRRNLLIREVGKDADNIWRHLVIETVDTDGHRLGYEECVEFHFDRKAEKINIKNLSGCASDPDVTEVTEEVKNLYTTWNNALTPYTVRQSIRKIVLGMGATILRDGVYFVRNEFADKVDTLEEVVGNLPGGSNFHSLPLIDDQKQREMLKLAFEEESVGEVDSIIGEIRDIIQNDRKVTSDRFAEFKLKYDELKGKTSDYSELLGDALLGSNTRLELMDKAIFELMGRIRVT